MGYLTNRLPHPMYQLLGGGDASVCIVTISTMLADEVWAILATIQENHLHIIQLYITWNLDSICKESNDCAYKFSRLLGISTPLHEELYQLGTI